MTLWLSLGFAVPGLAEEYRRKISLEWEPIPEAFYYDVEIRSTEAKNKEKPKEVLVRQPEWSGKLIMGGYTLRVRGRDRRKVPGDWSETQEFFVGLESPKVIMPKNLDKIQSKNEDEHTITFRWTPVGGAEEYQFDLVSKDGKISQSKKTSKTELTFTLPVASEFSWKVNALGPRNINSNNPATADFTVMGPKLAKPLITEPANGFVRELTWDRPPHTENYEYAISKWDPKEKKWVAQGKRQKTPDMNTPFPAQWPGGHYKMSLQANGNLRPSSVVTSRTFDVVNGNRSPAAEEIATVRESIDRTTGWFAIASYLVTAVTYKGVNSDATGVAGGASFDGAVGGTGRLGLGYLSPKSPWGFLGITDYSGILVNNNVVNYGSLEGNALYRTNIGDRSELRQQFGMFYKEYPVIIPLTTNSSTSAIATTAGPHYGVEYWHALSSKLGFQLNAHGYLNAMTIKSPNGNNLNSDFSYQFGFLGSYRISRYMTGLLGYANRTDMASYPAKGGGTNTATITGNYVNFFLEWEL